jgi:hypothetical protein
MDGMDNYLPRQAIGFRHVRAIIPAPHRIRDREDRSFTNPERAFDTMRFAADSIAARIERNKAAS